MFAELPDEELLEEEQCQLDIEDFNSDPKMQR